MQRAVAFRRLLHLKARKQLRPQLQQKNAFIILSAKYRLI